MTHKTKGAALVACMLAIGVASAPQNASAVDVCSATPPTQQTTLTRPIPLGISGGNIRSLLKNKKGQVIGCLTGTLGSMVQDSNNVQYILSNNHVLADTNIGKAGQPIVQPGLGDVQCLQAPSNEVATLSRKVKIKFSGKNTVDAA